MSLHFKLIKTDNIADPTPFTYIKWIVVIVLVGISVSSFLTQSILAVKDRFFASNETPSVALAQKATSTKEAGLGSDDDIYQEGSIEAEKDSFKKQYTLTNVTQFPRVTAKGFLAADLKTGEIILEQGEDLVAPVASVTKLMTALVAREKLDLQKVAIVSRDSFNTFGSEGELRLGEKIRLYDLMHPLLMESSNDGAEVITEAYDKGRDAFMAQMNKKAKEIGMTNTYYEDPSGLDPRNVSTIEDLMKLGKYVWEHEPTIFDMTRVRQYAILGHKWFNKNAFLKYDSFMGGKNGYIDESKKTTVSLFNTPLARGGSRQVIVVLLKSDDREGDAVKVLNFLKKNAIFGETKE
jgi:D-alanyl-D-alanine carboxypeptidase